MEPSRTKNLSLGSTARWLALVAVPLALALIILLIRYPFPIRPLSIAARYSFAVVLPVVLLISYRVLRLPGWWGKLALASWVTILFALAVAGFWASLQSEDQALSGLLPWNDSKSYYVDGLRLLIGQGFSVISSRRPMLPAIFAVILAFSGRNLQMGVTLLAGLNALACFLAVRAVQRTHGPAPAALVLTLLFFYARRYTATITTESLGLTLGLLGFALLWRSVSELRKSLAVLGILALSFASNARPGALFILPLAVLWAGWLLRGPKRFSFLVAGLGAAAVAAGFAANSFLFGLLAPPGATSFSNMPYILYGVAVGGKGWTQYRTDHPEVIPLSEAERSSKIMQLTLHEMRYHPLGFVTGALKQYSVLISKSYYSLYSFVSYGGDWLTMIMQGILYALCIVALIAFLRRWKDPYLSLAVLYLVGTLLSVPFSPPTDANRMRLFAATIVVLAVLPALGLGELISLLHLGRWLGSAGLNGETDSPRLTQGLTLGLIGVILLAPPLLLGIGRPPALPALDCPSGTKAAYLRYDPGTWLQVIPEKEFYLDWLPVVHAGRFKAFLHNTGNIDTIQDFDVVQAPATILLGLDLKTGQPIWLVADPQLLPAQYGLLGVCGRTTPDSILFWAVKVTALK